ncbi:MAG: glycoside hydrolase family 97 protein [Planctomycetes bacterium]|nr:glycoside hydrolase family 97 protein [Planctomycetota bacterium]
MSIGSAPLRIVLGLVLSLAGAAALAAEAPAIVVRSPDGKNVMALGFRGEGKERQLLFDVTRKGKLVLEPSKFDAQLAGHTSLAAGARLDKIEKGTSDETFTLPWGKTKVVVDRCSWARARLASGEGVAWELELRGYDDGVAFRYLLPEQETLNAFRLAGETTEFRFAGEPAALYTTCKNFTTDHETTYEKKRFAELPRAALIDLPFLAIWPDGSAAAVTEARVRDFTNMYLERTADPSRVVLASRLSPLPGRMDAVAGQTPHASPWRVILLSDQAGRLLESNLLLCLNDPPSLDKFEWAQPGKTTWHWWNGTFESGLPFNPGMNFATHKYYIDFCARHGIAYHAVVADARPWYVQSQSSFSPGPDTDILAPRPELEFPRLLEYAKERGVGIRLWIHWKALKERIEEAFARYESWGVRGLMVDFLDRDDQEIVNFCERVLASAARHKLHVQFHGSYKPSGEQRTFPNLFNREGVLNLEYLKWSTLCTPDHNVNVAYTRQLAGPLDYHLGGFRSASRSRFEAREVSPYVLGTRCHHLALYVVYENPMPMISDAPRTYEGKPGFEFLVEVPTTWDETRFVAGEASEYLVVARRQGTTWYAGGITNWTPRQVTVPLGFLGSGPYEARLWVDGSPDEEQPNAIRTEQRPASAGESWTLDLAPGGGFVAAVRTKK